MKPLLRLRLAIAFLTRVPVGDPIASDQDFAGSLGYFAIVGAAIGVLLSGTAWLLAPHLPPTVIAGLLLAISAAITGGLHLDGLADVFDGLGGGRGDANRMLEIMRDSRIGSHGAVALIVYSLLKLAVLAPLVGSAGFVAIASAPAVARALLVPLIIGVPYARAKGLGTAFQAHAGLTEILLATGAIGAVIAIGGQGTAAACAVAAGSMALFTALIVSKIRGLTGDGYGALIELGELAFLTAILWH